MADKVYYIWKEKNFFCVAEGHTKKDKFIKIDYSTGQFYGVSGKAVVRTPSGFGFCFKDTNWYGKTHIERNFSNEYVKNLFSAYLAFRGNNWVAQDDFLAFEKVASAFWGQNYLLHFHYSNTLNRTHQILEQMEDEKISFKDVFKEIHNEETTPVLVTVYELSDVVSRIILNRSLERYKKHVEILGEDAVIDIINSYRLKPVFENHETLIWNWLENEEIQNMINLGIVCYDTLIRAMCEAFRYAQILNRTFEKGSPLRQWAYAKRDYIANRDKIANETIAKFIKECFNFEDENFIAITPKSIKDLTDEGNAMNNCVGGMWLKGYGNCVYEGEMARGIVFIRKKNNPDESFVDCDFDLLTGTIHQFLGKHNRSMKIDEQLIQFRNSLQEHLRKVCQG